ncbi:hypothetical protein [Ostreibacterium oceani]|uniref:Uncharacterized protein n=1 Tax=Ostreibacterium oceani TaxID=2654998 RepID=A0A6N7F3S4_9GAMM|nr:hypothetical protein [Ostreibacterium oceani]MPV86526.1 hypothetical protein [Ostreibacterium oceani]
MLIPQYNEEAFNFKYRAKSKGSDSYDRVGNRLSELLGNNAGTNTNAGQWNYNARDQLINTPLKNL